MGLIRAIASLFIALPEILRLIKNLEKRSSHNAKVARAKEDVKKINEAFESKDMDKLNEIFNS